MNIKGTDIVKRLREHIVSIPNLEEAAAEIDRLRAENAEIRKAMQEIYDKPQLAAVISSAILAKMTKEGE